MPSIEICDDTVQRIVLGELKGQLGVTGRLLSDLQVRIDSGETLPDFELVDYHDLTASYDAIKVVISLYGMP